MQELSDALAVAVDLAHQAGALLRQIYEQGPKQVQAKQTAVDLVTEADLASQKLLVAGLQAAFPGHAIVAEEAPAALPAAGAFWAVDPLDGTTNFAHGYPVFSVTLALLVDRVPLLGVTYDPLRDDLYWALQSQGAWRNGRRLQVSATSDLGQSLLATGFHYDRATNPDNNLAEFSYFVPRTRGVRRAGSAALDLAAVACGWLDGFWEKGLNVWDVAAGVLLIREAGGQVMTYDGRPWQATDRNILVSNGVDAMREAFVSGLAAARKNAELGTLNDGSEGTLS